MLKINKSLTILLLVILAICNRSFGQSQKLSPVHFYVFDKDSLQGFDEDAARKSAISEQFLGAEFKVRMSQLKRSYINNKYNIMPVLPGNSSFSQYSARTSVVPGCTNEDFEAAAAGTITTGNAINGWVLSGGQNDPFLFPGANSCNLLGCCTSPPSQSAIFTTPFVDPTVGAQYPIYSVFGTSTVNATAAAAANPQITTPLFGDKVIRINNDQNDYSIEKLSKTFAVTANNALFQFAFISVFATGHPCCDAGAFRIRLLNASGGNTVIACPAFSVSAPSTGGCAGGPGTPNYYLQQSLTQYTLSNNGDIIYNPWQISSIDLTTYIGQNITIEIVATDCTAGGHYGYCYFDAQCGPMTIYGNGTGYGAGVSTATVPTCGAAGATLCASDGLGPYSWAGPGVGPPYTTFAMSNQCYTTNLSGTYTLYMNPAGSCAPISRIISATITPAPLLAASVVQAVCGATTAVVTLTPSGSAAVPSTITYTPAYATVSSNSLISTYTTGPGAAHILTITATDPLGCLVVVHPTVNAAAPQPTFAIINVTGSPSITCNNPFIHLSAISNYSYGTLSYTWNSPSTYSVGDEIEAYTPGVFTVTALDAVNGCSVVHMYTVGINVTTPTVTIAPPFQNISCVSALVTFTATSNPTVNIRHYFYYVSSGGAMTSVTSPTAIYSAFSPGVIIDSLVNEFTGCYTTKMFTVTSNDNFPTLNVSSPAPSNFTVGCNTHSIATVNLSGATTPTAGGNISFAIYTSASPTNATFGGTSSYTFATPGTYTAAVKDVVSGCITKVPFTIIQNIVGPNIVVDVPDPILSCYTPSTVLTASTPDPGIDFAWSYHNPAGSSSTVSVPNTTVGVTTTTVQSNITSGNVDNFTITLHSSVNGCYSSTVIPIRQNVYKPNAIITPINPSLTCASPSVTLRNGSTTGILPAAGFPTVGIIVADWSGPSPQIPATGVSLYDAFVIGRYTMTVTDLNNGCKATAVDTVKDNRKYPIIIPSAVDTLDCSGTKTITARIDGPTATLVYHWSASSTTPLLSLPNAPIQSINLAGHYNVTVTNPTTGCTSSGEIIVVNGSLTAGFQPDATTGFAPLTVNFANTSHSSAGNTSSVVSVWNYGNGTTATYSTTTNGAAVYTQPGTYTVTLFTTKGSCTDIHVETIHVDIPSSLEVPNVFTPNGDGINDVFFLKVSNMTEINASIFDRWGRKVYELTSTTGNIAWDGTNMVGTKVAAGVYFYVIKGKGKDDKSYDTKGTINLYK